jgi:hypothetical protein
MLGFLLLLICLITTILLIILGYLYNLILEEDKLKNKEWEVYEDDKKIYNYNILLSKLNLAKILKDDTLLVGNDTLNEEGLFCKKFNLFDNLEYDMRNRDDLELKRDEKYFLKKIVKK